MSVNEFEALRAANERGVEAVLETLSQQLRARKKYHELFEALKMQLRRRLGLPLLYSDSGDDLNEERRKQLEDGLIDACREVGLLLLDEGRVREGWMYLRPVGDKKAAAELLAKIPADEENTEELVDVCLREGVDVERGFQLVLKNHGTCNAITTFEGEMPRHPRREQQIAARLLVKHLYDELSANLKADIARQEGSPPQEQTLRDLSADRPWLFQELSYHVDTTHLASVIRFARVLEDAESLRLALDMTEYGRRLHKQFQYQGDEPFTAIYPSHALFFQALLGENVDAALAYFRERADACEPRSQGTSAIEVYVDLLGRLGRYGEAIDAAIRLTPDGTQSQGLAPSLLELCQQAGNYDRLLTYCRERDDLLGFAAGLVKANRGD